MTGYAGPKEDYEKAHLIYLAAGASAAAYNDRLGEMANHYLAQEGWRIDHYVQENGHSGARYLIASKPDVPYFLIAIVGTETEQDIQTDLRVGKVYFAGSTADECSANAAKPDVPDTLPKVHDGFNRFLQAGLGAVLENSNHHTLYLPDLLKDPTKKLYITGHSLGGAAATLAGARLLDRGTPAQQLEVITFGAPAVGNPAFAAKFGPTLPLIRVVNSGDPVTGVLQTLVGSYQQFGEEIKWYPPDSNNNPHELTGYLDEAIKNYYDKRRLAVAARVTIPLPHPAAATNKTETLPAEKIYIAPLQNHLPSALTPEFEYMNEIMQDEYEEMLPNAKTATQSDAAWQEQAAAAQCGLAIIPEVSAVRVKQEENVYYITLTQTIRDVRTGRAIDMASFSTATYKLTPVESFIHTCRDINAHLLASPLLLKHM